jgi:hypothetical protein
MVETNLEAAEVVVAVVAVVVMDAAEVILDEVEMDVEEEVKAADQWNQTMEVNSNKSMVMVLDMIIVLQRKMNLTNIPEMVASKSGVADTDTGPGILALI